MIIIPLSRREALARMIAAAALAGSLDLEVFAAGEPQGFGDDPNLLEKEIPWPRALSEGERRTTTALADVILPADELGPAASTVGVTDFIDEWVSAPYPQQQREGKIIREGLAWIETAAMKHFGKSFAAADVTEQSKLLDEIIDRQSGA
ncbi:MAG TPA: gluconate 2-dehydrogenase subunit 3 family protein, partial [Chthoniobacteraceae bacterium]